MPTDPLGIEYTSTWTDSAGTRHYHREYALGGGLGPAQWSDEHDCNRVCGCHLASQCQGCGCCTSCAGCMCGEGEY